MRDGFIKVAASTPEIRVADVDHNKKLICEGVDQAWKEGVQLLAYPELCLTGYTCGDLFWQEELLDRILGFIAGHCSARRERLEELMLDTGMLTKDLGTILVGKQAVEEGIIDRVGGIRDAVAKLRKMICTS